MDNTTKGFAYFFFGLSLIGMFGTFGSPDHIINFCLFAAIAMIAAAALVYDFAKGGHDDKMDN